MRRRSVLRAALALPAARAAPAQSTPGGGGNGRALDGDTLFEIADGRATAVTLHQNGREMRGLRQSLQP